MTSSNFAIPDEDELRVRILRHLSWRNNVESNLLWHGYVNALLEWGLIGVESHRRLSNLLSEVGKEAAMEMFLDLPYTDIRANDSTLPSTSVVK